MLNYIRRRPVLAAVQFASLLLMLFPGLLPAGLTLGVGATVTGGRANPATSGSPTGAIDSSSRVIDMSDTIHLLDPNEAPLTAITMKLRKAHCISPKVEWLEDDYLPVTATLAASVSSVSASLTFATASGVNFRPGDILQNMVSGENVYIQAADATSATFTVARAIGTSSQASYSATTTETWLVIGNANQEGATGRAIKTTQKENKFNFTQIFRWPFGLSGTLNNTEVYGGSDLNYQARKAGIEHRISMERSFMFGIKSDTSTVAATNSAPIRFCDGILARVTSNVSTASGTLTSVNMQDFLNTGMRYGPARKMLFASRLFVSRMNGLAESKIVTVPTTSSFPLAITEYVSPHGKVYIVTHNLLTGAVGSTQKYGGYGLLLDMDSIFYRYLQGRDTKVKTNIQANDADARTDEYITEACPMVIQEKNHMVINSVIL